MELAMKNKEAELLKSNFTLFELAEGTREMHALVESGNQDTISSWISVNKELERFEDENGFSHRNRLFTRVFLNDVTVQAKLLRENFPEAFEFNISLVGQVPLTGASLAVWVYWIDGEKFVKQTKFGNVFQSNGLSHVWTAGIVADNAKDVAGQTTEVFEKYKDLLVQFDSSVKDNSLRTWLFSRDVDNEYSDLVSARNEFFDQNGLSNDTHFIASTGIQGSHEDPGQLVLLDTYSVAGIDQEQIEYLYAPTHLCPTHNYGVAFERGTTVTYGDRKHVIISGTASINNKGEVICLDDPEAQAVRAIENTNVLLAEADCELSDLAIAIVYLRNTEEIDSVKKIVEEKLPDTPTVYVHGPVCRPTWLVEIEGIAIKEVESEFKKY
jgi:enamine deaminase RidA (YjgF/YER057c/UK114 family)